LVYNGSFEQHDTCPSDYDQIRHAFYWNGIDTTYYYGVTAAYQNFLPDYMNTCDVGGFCRVPNNPYFFHYPHTGDGMMENIMYYDMVYLITTGYSAYNYTKGD
jgi:hypothetical protein